MDSLAVHLAENGPLDPHQAAGWTLRLLRSLRPMHATGECLGMVDAAGILAESLDPTGRAVLSGRLPRPNLAYRSPERLELGGLSEADDTWAAAVVLFLLSTGRLPYVGKHGDALLREMGESPPPPLAALGIDDEALQDLFNRSLCRPLHDRVTESSELEQALVAYVGAAGESLPPLEAPGAETQETAALLAGEASGEVTEQGLDDDDFELEPLDRDSFMLEPVDDGPDLSWEPKKAGDPAQTPLPVDVASSEPSLEQEPENLSASAKESVPPRLTDEERAPLSSLADVLEPSVRHPDVPQPPDSGAGSAAHPVVHESPSTPLTTPKAASAPPRPSAKGGSPWLLYAGLVVGAFAITLGGLKLFGPKIKAEADSSAKPAAVPAKPPEATAPKKTADKAPKADPSAPVASAPKPATAKPSASSPASAAAPSTTSSTTSPAAPKPSTTNTAASKSPPNGADLEACVLSAFPKNTFGPSQRGFIGKICSEQDPRRGGTALRTAVTKAGYGKAVSTAMREWAVMGWYEMPAFAAIRGKCCASPEPLVLPQVSTCQPMEKALNQLATAVAAGKPENDPAILDARKRFLASVYCALRSGGGFVFHRKGPPMGGEDTSFQKTLRRLVSSNLRG